MIDGDGDEFVVFLVPGSWKKTQLASQCVSPTRGAAVEMLPMRCKGPSESRRERSCEKGVCPKLGEGVPLEVYKVTSLGLPVVPLYPFFREGSPKIDYNKKVPLLYPLYWRTWLSLFQRGPPFKTTQALFYRSIRTKLPLSPRSQGARDFYFYFFRSFFWGGLILEASPSKHSQNIRLESALLRWIWSSLRFPRHDHGQSAVSSR